MEVIFQHDYLEELYSEGKCRKKKYRFQLSIVEKYIRRIDTLKAASRIEDLYPFHSLNYEKLQGDLNGFSSIRVDKQYRIIFKEEENSRSGMVMTICRIEELSNHYD